VIPALAALTLLATPPADTARLVGARIRVLLAGDTAQVEARYRLAGAGASRPVPVRFTAPRLAGQSVTLDSTAALVSGPPALLVRPSVLTARPGLWGVDVDLSTLPGGRIDLVYRVVGRAKRIPLFVPDMSADPQASPITILVRGAPAGLDPAASFPRLVPAGPGTLAARPSQLPDVLHLPGPSAADVGRAADIGTIVLVLAGLAGWGFHERRRARREGPA